MPSIRREFFAVCFLLGSTALLPGALAQTDDDDLTETGEDVQEVLAYFEDGEDNEAEDIAVAGVFHREKLYVAATTTTSLEGENAGGTDFIVKSFDEDLETEEFVQYGGAGDDIVNAMAADDISLDIVVVGSTESDDGSLFDLGISTGGKDWFIALLDREELTLNQAYVNGTTDNDQEATVVAVTSDGDFIVAGWTWGEYFAANAGADNDESEVGYDVWVIKINSDLEANDGDYEWATQFGTEAYDEPTSIVVDDSTGYVFVTGTTTDNDGVIVDADDTENVFVYCLDIDTGETIWARTTALGVQSDGAQTEAHGIVISEDGTEVYVSGNTKGVIPGFEGEETDEMELFVMGLDIETGVTNWVYQSESNATAFGTAGVVLADDGSPIIGGYAFGNHFNLSSSYWQTGAGDMIAAKIDPETQEVLKYFVVAAASNLTEERALAMVKVDDLDDGVYLMGRENGIFDDEESVGNDEDLNYLIVKVELEELPEEEDDDSSELGDYWPIGLSVYALGGIVFCGLYKWAEHSVARKARVATMV